MSLVGEYCCEAILLRANLMQGSISDYYRKFIVIDCMWRVYGLFIGSELDIGVGYCALSWSYTGNVHACGKFWG